MARDRGLDRSLVGYYSGVICKRRRRGGTEAGVWPALHELLDGPRPPGSCTWLIAGGSVFLLVGQQENSSCGAVVHGEHVRPERPAIGITAPCRYLDPSVLVHREDLDSRVAEAVLVLQCPDQPL